MTVIYCLKGGIMTRKCLGCGAIFQNTSSNMDGYVKDPETAVLCERCFRIKHYSEYKQVVKTNQDFLPILNEINQSNDLVLVVADLFSLNESFAFFEQNLTNPKMLVLTKRDILPYSVSDETLISHLDLKMSALETQVVSSYKNYELDSLMEKIEANRTSNRIYIVGYTNAGKSTLINHILKHYYRFEIDITTSPLPSTTLSSIVIDLPNLTIVDTPGFLEEGSMIDSLNGSELKRVLPKKEIKPITYQMKTRQTILIDQYAYLTCLSPNNCTFFFSNALNIDRTFKDVSNSQFECSKIQVDENEDIVISGLGFIKCMKSGTFEIYTYPGVKLFTRRSLI